MSRAVKDRRWMGKRAARPFPDVATRGKHVASAKGVCEQRVSQWKQQAPRVITDLYEWLRPLAEDERTTVTPIGWDLVKWGIECKLGDLDTSALMREAVIRMHRTDEYAALEAKAIAQLLAERGIPAPEGP